MSRRSSGANKGRKSRPNTPPGKVQAAYKQRVEQLLQQGRLEQAEQIIAALLEQRPEEGDALLLAGKIALQKGEYIRALQFFDRVMQGDTTSHEARYLSSYALYNLGQFEPALAHINSAISLAQPDRADYLFQKGTILMALWRYSEAEPIFTQLLEAYPRNVLYLNNAGNLYRDLGQFERAETIFRRAMAADPKNSFPYSNLLTTLHYDPHRERDEIHTVCLEWEKRYAANYSRLAVETDRTKERRLRIGLISDGFRNHPVGRMIIAALERLPREAYAFFAYSSTGSSDAITDRFKKIGHYEVTSHLSDAQLAEKIRTDRIDILFDLSGHNSGMRMPVMAMKPAPLQVKWVGGLINTTGLSTIDYLISDAIETPLEEEPFYSEKLIRMPGDYVCYELPDYTPPVNSLPAQTNGYITLGCFNNPAKINAVVLEQWAMIMHQLANSRLYLKGHQFKGEDLRENIYRQLEAHGIERARVTIEGPSSHKELLACYNRVDIALDPWPYSGGLTTCEAFVMGVPVVTLPGPTFAGRHSATHLVNAGMPELVTHSWDEYRARVIELASDLDSLAIIRSHLRTILLQSPVCDAATFATHLNNALRAIWQRYCEGKQPEALSFTEQGEVLFADATEPMPLHHPQPPQPQEDEQFTWEFEGRVIAIDHGGQLMDVPVIKQMLDLGTLELITFDPASNYLKHPLRQHNSVHYYPNVALGDGQPATLYACQAPEQSGTLKPAPHEYMPEKLQQELTLLAELPIATVALDKASELPAVDWLVLDDLNDAMAILENGEATLKKTLLIHVKLAFQPTHQRQPNFSEVAHWASRQGFRFYTFQNEKKRTPIPDKIIYSNPHKDELINATALFIPNHDTLKKLTKNQLRKLAFIADNACKLSGLSYEILEICNEGEIYIGQKNNKIIKRNIPKKPQKTIKEIIKNLKNTALKKLNPNHDLPSKLVVSLTSYKDRFPNLELTIRSLLEQKTHPDKIILWISEEEKLLLPDEVRSLENFGLEIRFCDDIKSYKKIIPTLLLHPDYYIVTADDDLYYDPSWLGALIEGWKIHKQVICHRAHKILLDSKGYPVPYKNWDWQANNNSEPDGLLFPTSGAGTLYPPGTFNNEVFNKDNFMSICDGTDDIWLYWMMCLNGKKAVLTNHPFRITEWPHEQANPLWHENLLKGKNDKNIKLMIKYYGLPWKKTDKKSHAGNNIVQFYYSQNNIKFYLPNKKDHIQKIIRETKSFYEIEMLNDIKSRAKPGMSFLDIGSNIGNHSIFFAKICKAKKVFAFEPQKEVFRILLKNIKINKSENIIHAFNLAIGDSNYKTKAKKINPDNLGATAISNEKFIDGDISVVTLCSIIPENTKIDIIKVDVEGMEIKVLKGSLPIIERDNPIIYAEASTEREFSELKEFLRYYHYKPTCRFNATPTYLFEPEK